MKKRYLLIALGILLVASLLLVVACDKKPTAKLTLNVGQYGTMETTEYDVQVGTSLKEFLSDKLPACEQNIEFDSWQEGNAPVADDRTMPKDGLTLNAHYLAQYTAHVYTQSLDGTYGQPTEVKGKGEIGVAMVYQPDIPTHFSIDSSAENYKVRTESLAPGEEFSVYLKRNTYFLTFDGNAPSGETAKGEVQDQSVLYGNKATIPQNLFEVSRQYRFDGWATSANGEAVYKAGDEIAIEEDTILYAVWYKGLQDLFGGSDILYVYGDKVVLNRELMDEQTAALENGIFNFDNGLGGKVLNEGFYYFRDTVEKEYSDADSDSDAKLTLHAQGKASFKENESAAVVSGNYDLEPSTGFYLFQSEQLNFRFVLRNAGARMAFQRPDTEMEGYYALKADGKFEYPLVYLNGVGDAKYIMDSNTYEATYGGEPILEYTGTYTETWSKGTYEISLYFNNMAIKRLYVRFTKGDVPNVSEADGYYELNDGFTGEFTSKTTSEKKLLLDGYGKGTYNDKEGTYRVVNHTWLYINFSDLTSSDIGSIDDLTDIIDTYYVQYIEFTPNGESDSVILFIWDEEDDWDGTVISYYIEVADEGYGRFDISNNLVLQSLDGIRQSGAFVYIYPKGPSDYKPQIWIPSMSLGGKTIYMSYDTAKKGFTLEDGYLTLNMKADSWGDVTETIRFALSKNASLNVNGVLEYVADVIEVDDNLSIDEKGVAHFGDKTVDYTFSSEVVDVYTFDINGAKRVYYYIEGHFYLIKDSDIYAEYFSHPARNDGYKVELVRVTDSIAVLRIEARDYYGKVKIYCAISGSYTAVEGKTDEFNFADTFVDVDSADAVEIYENFRFKLANGQFVRYDKELNVGGLTTDGYGAATYTKDSEWKGSYAIVNEVILFSYSQGELAFKVTGDTIKEVNAAEVATYYVITADGVSSYEQYFLDGDGNAVYRSYSADNDGFVDKQCTYKHLKTSIKKGYEEYEITFADETVARIATTLREDAGRHIGYYIARDNRYIVDVKIVDESGTEIGKLFCNGYDLGLMTLNGVTVDAEVVRCDILDGDATELSYELSADGKQIMAVTEDGAYHIFDLKDGGKAVERLLPYGTYTRLVHGVAQDETMYLDGHGNAERFDADGESMEQGSYTLQKEDGSFVYKGNSGSFVFTLEETSTGFVYNVLDAEQRATLYSQSEWSVLALDGYGTAMFVDKYGVVGKGTYVFVTDWLVQLQSSLLTSALYFDVDLEKGTQKLFTDEFVHRAGVLYGYTGSATSIKIPDGVTTIYANTFAQSTVEHIDFNGVTRIEAGAFAASMLAELNSDKLEYIGEGAFRGCRFLESANIPAVTEIAAEAFYYCTALTEVKLGAIAEIGDRAFSEFKSSQTASLKFDLTAVESVASITLGENVFMAFFDNADIDEGINIALIVKDIDNMNAVLKGSGWALVKDSVTMPIGEEDGRRYVDIDSGTVYELHNGYLCIVVTGAYTLKYTSIGLYTLNEDGDLLLHSLNADGAYSEGTNLGNKVLSKDGKLLWQLGAEQTLTVDGKQLTFTLDGTYDTYKYVFNFSVAGSYEDKKFGEGSFVDNVSHSILVTLEDQYKKLQFTDKDNGTLTPAGDKKEFSGESNDSAHSFLAWKMTAIVSESKIVSILKFEVKGSAYSTSYAEYTVVSVSAQTDGNTLLTAAYYGQTKCFVIKLDGDTMTITYYGKLEKASDDVYSATFIINDDEVLELVTFSIDGKEVEFTVQKQADGSFNVTVDSATYKVTLSYNEWIYSYELTVTKTN